MAIGTLAQSVNSKKMEIWVGTSTNTWTLLQNARVLISHPIYREPTTSGGVATFTGAPDHTISGSLIFSRDEWSDASGFDVLSTVSGTTGEVPANSWAVKFTDISTGTTTLTFTNAKLSVVDISKSVEGGVKVDVTVVCPDEPA